MQTLYVTKPSLPFAPGDVITVDDDRATKLMAHPSGVVRLATDHDITEATNKHRRPSQGMAAPRKVPSGK